MPQKASVPLEKAPYPLPNPGAREPSPNPLPDVTVSLQVQAQVPAPLVLRLAPLEGVAPHDHLALLVATDLITAAAAAARASATLQAMNPNPAATTAATALAPVIVAATVPLALHHLVGPTLALDLQREGIPLLQCASSPRMCLQGTTSLPLGLLSPTGPSWRRPYAHRG